jgi:hypothetical protein
VKAPVVFHLSQSSLDDVEERTAAHLIAANAHAVMPANIPVIRNFVVGAGLSPANVQCSAKAIVQEIKLLPY